MYITELKLENVRTFLKNHLLFVHPDLEFGSRGSRPEKASDPVPKPKLPNVNLLLGDNGSGKSTLLRAIALAACGPAVKESGLRDPGLIRRKESRGSLSPASLKASFLLHDQDQAPGITAFSDLAIRARGDYELLEPVNDTHLGVWDPVYESHNESFFVVGYGATRRIELPENFDLGARTKARPLRSQRVAGLFEDSFSLIPLTFWLPKLKKTNKGRYTQVVHLLDRLLGPGHYRFTETLDARGDYLFERGGLRVPLQSLSDGYRAFIGWVADLLYHMVNSAPSGKKLDEWCGLVLVDEIDLHLHPRWQLEVIPTVARLLPRMQFVFTSHSPLVAGSLEWMNIITLKTQNRTNRATTARLTQSIHGLDADQILLSDFFGLKSTTTPEKLERFERLRDRIRAGDEDAPLALIREMTQGTEEEA